MHLRFVDNTIHAIQVSQGLNLNLLPNAFDISDHLLLGDGCGFAVE